MNENPFSGVSQVQASNDLEKFLNLDDSLKLTRQYLKEENEWKKTKAILEQKIELLKMEIEDAKKREENLHRMNESILASLNDLANDTNKPSTSKTLFKDIFGRLDEYNKDFLEKKDKAFEVATKYEKENKELRESLNEFQVKFKEGEFVHEKQRLALEHKIQELELMNRQLKASQKTLEEERKKFKEICEKESMAKYEDFARETELLKQNHQFELERMRQVSGYEINELRELYEKEKSSMDVKIDRLEKDLREYRRMAEDHPKSSRETFSEENLNILIQDITEKKENRIKDLEAVNYELTKKVQNLEKEHRESNNPGDQYEMISLRKENLIQGKTISELRKKNESLEESLSTMKQILNEKDARIEDLKSHIQMSVMLSPKKQADEENENLYSKDQKRNFKYSYQKEEITENQPSGVYRTPLKGTESYHEPSYFGNSNYNTQKEENVKEFINREYIKEGVISRDYTLNQRSPIRRFQREVKRSPYAERAGNLSNNNVMDLMKSTTSIQYKAQEALENYSELEETEKNNGTVKRKYYSRNVEDKDKSNLPVNYEEFLNHKHKKVQALKENNQEKINEDILNILMQLNKEKTRIEEKLSELEKRLSESENTNENLLYEKEKLKSELLKIYQELRVAKSGFVQIEQEESLQASGGSIQKQQQNNSVGKTDKEATLKTEIKFLINKLLKAKGKLVKEKNDLSLMDSGQKVGNYYSVSSSNFEPKRSSEQKTKVKNVSYLGNAVEGQLIPQRSKTPILKETTTRSKEVFYVKENVTHL